jgi:hypothetical protein
VDVEGDCTGEMEDSTDDDWISDPIEKVLPQGLYDPKRGSITPSNTLQGTQSLQMILSYLDLRFWMKARCGAISLQAGESGVKTRPPTLAKWLLITHY